MEPRELIAHHPRLFHMADAGGWPTIERLGLRSVTSLLDLFSVDQRLRRRLESERRQFQTTLEHPEFGRIVIRDQGPLNVAKLQACLTDMSVEQWLNLLNRKVFFWPTESRVEELLGARAYRDRAHLVLVVDRSSLVAAHADSITIAAINTGATLYNPPQRGTQTLRPIRRFDPNSNRRIAEVAVDYAVPDIAQHLIRVERRQAGEAPEVLQTFRSDPSARRATTRPVPAAGPERLAARANTVREAADANPRASIQVYALRNPNGSFRGKFHRHDSFDCPGRRMYEESHADQDDYVLVSLADLPDHQGACQFDCCFAGLRDAAAVRHGRAPATVTHSDIPPAAAPTGIRIGQRVEYRVLPFAPPTSRTIVPSRQGSVDQGEISSTAPIAQALVGHHAGDIVDAILPRGPVQIEIIRVDDP